MKGERIFIAIRQAIIRIKIVTPKVTPISDQYFSILLYKKDNWNHRKIKEPAKATGAKHKIKPKIILVLYHTFLFFCIGVAINPKIQPKNPPAREIKAGITVELFEKQAMRVCAKKKPQTKTSVSGSFFFSIAE